MTDFVRFTQDPEEDINNAPHTYHNFNSAGVRVRLYWTEEAMNNIELFRNSMRMIRGAHAILQKYTLSLNYTPSVAPESEHLKAKAQARQDLARNPIAKVVPRVLRDAAAKQMECQAESVVDRQHMKHGSVINFPGKLKCPLDVNDRAKEREIVRPLRNMIGQVTEENRLIIVFVPFEKYSGGYAAIFPDWLPWVVMDPNCKDSGSILLHEVGHACRLGHQKAPNNLMAHASDQSINLWAWQVDTIYDSYWCNGPRFKNWWERDISIRSAYPPFIWDAK